MRFRLLVWWMQSGLWLFRVSWKEAEALAAMMEAIREYRAHKRGSESLGP
jgi:hypothetical protein